MNRLERKFGWLAVGGLPLYIVTAQSILYLCSYVNPASQAWFSLDLVAVRYTHEYWRFLTFLFVVPTQNPIFAFFYLYLIYIYGTALENEWGSFHFSLFYYLGALGTSAAAFFFGGTDGAFYLNTSIFLAFAAVHPDFILYFFFVIPLKVKWLAIFTWGYFALSLWQQPLDGKMAILISMVNYFLFFSQTHIEWVVAKVRHFQHKNRFKEWK